jgi:hypothetical protein
MAISSVTTNVPAQPPVASTDTTQQKPPPPKNDSDNDDNNSVQQTRAPLPPGQGTRVDQLA